MHFSCQCGNVIHDTSDNLSYKGYIIADQDIDYLIETIEKLEKPHTQYIGVYDEISKLLRRTVYQCPDCGRVYIENLALILIQRSSRRRTIIRNYCYLPLAKNGKAI